MWMSTGERGDEKRLMLIATAFCFVVTYLVGYYGGPRLNLRFSATDGGGGYLSTGGKVTTTVKAPEVYIYNEYTATRPLEGSYPWENIVEPYRVTTLEIVSPEDGYNYVWYVDGWHQDEGTKVSAVFSSPTGVAQKISVEMRRQGSGEVVSQSEVEVMCKYVRREIRSLIDQDREAFFHAVAIMQRVPTQIGKKIYGKKYRSRDFFNRIHLYYGGSKSCDHWHQGPGFVTSHITFSLMYEQSLQAINPSVTLPYWDFTLESTLYSPTTFRDSGVFSSDWFGDAVCNNSYHTPEEGRFAYVPVMKDATNYSMLVNPYGLLRSPWNADPTPYLTRSSLIYNLENNLKPSGCMEYHHALGFWDWKNLAKQLNSNAHGHIHELVGGSWNSAKYMREPSTDSGMSEAYEFAHATEGILS